VASESPSTQSEKVTEGTEKAATGERRIEGERSGAAACGYRQRTTRCRTLWGMWLVAITRLGARGAEAPVELTAEVAALAPALGVGAYELRLALSGVPPVVLASTPDVERARAVLSLLRARGHGAVACDGDAMLSSEAMIAPREFAFGDDALVLSGHGAMSHTLAFADVLLIAEATHARQDETTEERSEKKLSVGRALLTGGLVNRKTHSTSSKQSNEERERVFYVLSARGQGHVLLREQRLRYVGLGARIGRTVGENFATLRALLRERAPGARFDDRLVRSARASGGMQISGSLGVQTVSQSNTAETDRAVQLLAVAHLQDQL
jgi:hypothetical protein